VPASAIGADFPDQVREGWNKDQFKQGATRTMVHSAV